MVSFTINDKKYKVKNLPLDITIREAIKLASLLKLSEGDYKALETFNIIDNTLNKEQRTFIIKSISLLSDIKFNDIKEFTDAELMIIFEYIFPLVNIIFYNNFEKYTPYGLTEIKFNNTIYVLPEQLEINGKNIQAFKEQSKNVVEAGNIISLVSNLKEQGIKYLPILCAIYLQPKGSNREYNEVDISTRAKLFEDLPFGVALDIFFFIYYYLINFVIVFRLSLVQKESLIQRVQKKLTTMFGFMKLQR